MYRFIFSIALLHCLLAVPTASQAKAYLGPTDFRIGTDIMRPAYYGAYEGTGPQCEVSSSVDFTRLMITGGYGFGSLKREGHNKKQQVYSVYTNKGQYFRAGLDYNFISRTPDSNVASLGLRCAISLFEDHLKSRVIYAHAGGNTDVPSLVGHGPVVDTKHKRAWAQWFELVGGIQAKVWASLYAGLTIRYKFRLRISKAFNHIPYEVLGWGQHGNHGWGINYYLLVRFPLKQFSEDEYLDT
ncbi:MAG: DUF6048 family protein [Bacteroidota bacterium]